MMGMTFWRIFLNPNAERVLGSMMAIFGLGVSPLCIPDFKQIEETCHHEDLTDLFIDILDDDLSTLGAGLLADGQKQTEARAADIVKVRTVEDNRLVSIIQQWSYLLLSLDGCGRVEAALKNGSQSVVLFNNINNNLIVY